MIPLIIFYIFIFSVLLGISIYVVESDESFKNETGVAAAFILSILWPIFIPTMIAYYITSKFFDKEQ